MKYAISNAGPGHQVHVYERNTGHIAWYGKWFLTHWLNVRHAEKICAALNKTNSQRQAAVKRAIEK